MLPKRTQAARLPLQLGSSDQLLVNCFWLTFGKELLKTRIVTDWVPHWLDLQARDGNVFTGRDSEQMAKYFCRLLGLASVRFDLG